MNKIISGFLSLVLVLGTSGGLALADDVTNNVDGSVDASLEIMNLSVGGATGSVTFDVVPQNGDGKNGCNLTADKNLTASVNVSNPSVASASQSSLTFTSCGDHKTIVVTGLSAGSATVSLTQTANTTDGTFNLAPASFTVNVTGAPLPPSDTTPPVLTLPSLIVAEATSGAGAVVTFSASATDETAPANPLVTCNPISGSTFSLGTTTVNCEATDTAGNTAHGNFQVVVVDTTAPIVSCDTADGLWHANDVSIACTSSDAASGLATSSDSNFSLITSVPMGTADANASTNSTNICDMAGNCTVAGPVTGNMIDKENPTISLTVPNAPVYTFHQVINAAYSCNDGAGSGIASCVGTVASGTPINTSNIGVKNFSVTATDNVGHTVSTSTSYNVVGYTFGGVLAPVSIDGKAFKKTSTIPVKFHLTNADGSFNGSAISTLTVNGVPAVSSGGSNTGNFFRYDVSGNQYIFNLSTKSLSLGTNTLVITLDDGSAPRTVTIVIR
jgi:hypothetical protein